MSIIKATEAQYRISHQTVQNRYVYIELLNYDFQTVDELSGVVTSGNISIDATSDIRRTASLEIVVTDTTFEVESGGKIWLDKYIRVHVGTLDIVSGAIEKINCGIFIIDAPNYRYDASTNTLTLSLLDLMAKLTGTRNGYLKGIPTIFKAGENIRQAMIDTLALGGFDKYVIEEAPNSGNLPNDLEFNQGSTIYDLLSGLKDVYPNYEIYFDIDGVFYYKPIPTGNNDPVVIDDTLWEDIVISEQLDVDFQNVKNSIEVYGRVHSPQHYAERSRVEGNTIVLYIEDVTSYDIDIIYGFTLTDNEGIEAPKLRINNLSLLEVLNDDNNPVSIKPEEGEVYYCVQYKAGHWRWLGHLQAYGFAEDTNPDSPFYVNSTVGRIRLPLFDGDYANCITDDLAQQRAEYELWLHTNLNNSVSISIIPVYWLDVNVLVEYTLKRNNSKNQYIIKSINQGLAPGDQTTINMIQFYPQPQYNET